MMETAIFAAGCFWGVEKSFQDLEGVIQTRVGYIGGDTKNPTYQAVCTGTTNHAEAVKIDFDPDQISYQDLLKVFFSIHDPTTLNRQGLDIGTQYRSVIFYLDENQQKLAEEKITALTLAEVFSRKIVTALSPAGVFYEAEEYHQKYLDKNGGGCHF